MKKYGFGVDVGGTTCKIGFFDMEGILLDKWEIRTDTSNNGGNILKNIAAALKQKMEKEAVKQEDVLGIGLGVPGPVQKDGLVQQCVNLGWENYRAADILADILKIPVKIGNDANMAALGEMWQGGGKGHLDVVMITLGTGVGGAVIVDGKVISGAHGIGGEIGHVKVDRNEAEVCACGKKGCLEQYASATGIARLAHKYLEENDTDSVLRSEKITAKAVFDAAKEKDTLALQILDEFGRVLGEELGNISCVIDPEVFVIGGGVSKAGDLLLDVVKKYYSGATLPGARGTEFALASLENDAGMYGCVRMLLDK